MTKLTEAEILANKRDSARKALALALILSETDPNVKKRFEEARAIRTVQTPEQKSK
jgi:hypothetical protein